MTIYFILAACLIAGCAAELLLFKFIPKKIAKIISAVLYTANAGSITYLASIRLNTGYDYHAYMIIMNYLSGNTIEELATEGHEKGYVLLNLFSEFFTRHPQSVMFVVAILIIVLVSITLYKMSPYPSMGLMLFYFFGYYFNSLNFMRNFIAAVIVMCAFAYIRKGSFIRYTSLVLLAATFHFSALIMLVFYPVLKIKFNLVTLAVYGFISTLIVIWCTDIMNYITTYIYPVYNPVDSPHMYKGIPVAYPIFLGIVFIVVFIYRKHFGDNWKTILVCAAYFSFFFEFLGSRHSILGRFTMYFGIIVACVAIPMLYKYIVTKIKSSIETKTPLRLYIGHFFSLGALTSAAAGFFIYAVLNNYNGVVPYDVIWSLFK